MGEGRRGNVAALPLLWGRDGITLVSKTFLELALPHITEREAPQEIEIDEILVVVKAILILIVVAAIIAVIVVEIGQYC